MPWKYTNYRLNHVAKDIDSEIYVKLEYLNPGGSIKDRRNLHGGKPWKMGT